MKKFSLFLSVVFFMIGACRPQDSIVENAAEGQDGVIVSSVVSVPLAGPMKAANAEISGLTLYEDILVLLPQYPDHYGDFAASGKLFALALGSIDGLLKEPGGQALRPFEIAFDDAGVITSLNGYEGFESIVFYDDWVYLTIETKQTSGMLGYGIRGRLEEVEDSYQITLEPDTLQEIKPQTNITNMTDEAILVYNEEVYTFYEANGSSVNPEAVAHRFDLKFSPQGSVSMVDFPYRLTDVSVVSSTGKFWAMNYFFPGDTNLTGDFESDPFRDPQNEHDSSIAVERIVPLMFDEDGKIQFDNRSVISLDVLPAEPRNWEGLVFWEGHGFLLVTDRFPGTILGFVAFVE